MSESYRRCRFIDANRNDCGVFFPSSSVEDLMAADDNRQYYCISHRDLVSTAAAAQGLNKDEYIGRRQEQEKFCHEMTLAELDAHIAKVEAEKQKLVEEINMKLLTARAVKAQKEDSLTEAERAERRKIRTPRVADPNKPKSEKKEKTSKDNFQRAVDSANAVRVAAGKAPMSDVQIAAFKISMGF